MVKRCEIILLLQSVGKKNKISIRSRGSYTRHSIIGPNYCLTCVKPWLSGTVRKPTTIMLLSEWRHQGRHVGHLLSTPQRLCPPPPHTHTCLLPLDEKMAKISHFLPKIWIFAPSETHFVSSMQIFMGAATDAN